MVIRPSGVMASYMAFAPKSQKQLAFSRMDNGNRVSIIGADAQTVMQ